MRGLWSWSPPSPPGSPQVAAAKDLLESSRDAEAYALLIRLLKESTDRMRLPPPEAIRLLPECATGSEQRAEVVVLLKRILRLDERPNGDLGVQLVPMAIMAFFMAYDSGLAAALRWAVCIALAGIAMSLVGHVVTRKARTRDMADATMWAFADLRATEALDALAAELVYRPRSRSAWEVIGELAGYVEEGDTILSPASQRTIAGHIRWTDDRAQIELLAKVGAGAALPGLERAASLAIDPEFRELVQQALPRIRARAERDRLGATLLHPASAPHTDADQLLRPASGPPEVDEQQLLRPGEGPKE